jgi:hypothetical protein
MLYLYTGVLKGCQLHVLRIDTVVLILYIIGSMISRDREGILSAENLTVEGVKATLAPESSKPSVNDGIEAGMKAGAMAMLGRSLEHDERLAPVYELVSSFDTDEVISFWNLYSNDRSRQITPLEQDVIAMLGYRLGEIQMGRTN